MLQYDGTVTTYYELVIPIYEFARSSTIPHWQAGVRLFRKKNNSPVQIGKANHPSPLLCYAPYRTVLLYMLPLTTVQSAGSNAGLL